MVVDVNVVDIQLNGASKKLLLEEKEFKTGSKGFNGLGKMQTPDGKKYQVNVLVVEIGSKPKTSKHKA